MMALVYNTIVFKNKQNYYGNSVDGYDHKTIIFNNVHDYIGNTKDNENAWFAGGGEILCKHNTTFVENTKKIIKMKIRNEEMFLYAKNPI